MRKVLACTTGTVLAIGAQACRAPEAASFDRISPGMSRQEVEAELGPPSSTVPAPEGRTWSSRSHWGDTLSTIATHAAMADQPPPPNVWTVWFDEQDVVLRADPAGTMRTPDLAPWEPPPPPVR